MSSFVRTTLLLFLLAIGSFVASPAQARMTFLPDTVTYTVTRPNAAAIHEAPVLENALVYDFYVSTPNDILVISLDALTPDPGGQFYLNPAVTLQEPPNAGSVAASPAIEFGSFFTTPGLNTAVASGKCTDWEDLDFSERFCGFAVFDVTDDGPQDSMHFARLTLAGDEGFTMKGLIHIANERVPDYLAIQVNGRGENLSGATLISPSANSVQLPEPGANQLLLWLVAGSFGCWRKRRVD